MRLLVPEMHAAHTLVLIQLRMLRQQQPSQQQQLLLHNNSCNPVDDDVLCIAWNGERMLQGAIDEWVLKRRQTREREDGIGPSVNEIE